MQSARGPIVISDSDDEEDREGREEGEAAAAQREGTAHYTSRATPAAGSTAAALPAALGPPRETGEETAGRRGSDGESGKDVEDEQGEEMFDSFELEWMQSDDDADDDDDEEDMDWRGGARRRAPCGAGGEQVSSRTRTARGVEERQEDKTYVAASKIEAVCNASSLDASRIGLTGEGLFAMRDFARGEKVIDFACPIHHDSFHPAAASCLDCTCPCPKFLLCIS